jgi:hypothetical protein
MTQVFDLRAQLADLLPHKRRRRPRLNQVKLRTLCCCLLLLAVACCDWAYVTLAEASPAVAVGAGEKKGEEVLAMDAAAGELVAAPGGEEKERTIEAHSGDPLAGADGVVRPDFTRPSADDFKSVPFFLFLRSWSLLNKVIALSH